MPTIDDLISLTLQELGVQQSGQPIAADDADLLKNRIPSIFAGLNARDVGFYDTQNLEDGDLLPLAQIIAYNSYNAFNVPNDKAVALAAVGGKYGEAERTLRDIRRLRSPRQTMRTEIFNRWRYGRWGI
jgi:hypothetical protein